MAYACNCPPGHHDGSVYRLCVVRESTSNDIVRCPPIPPGSATVSCEAALMVVCPHGNAAASYCVLCLRGRVAELEAERLPHMCRMDHPTVRFEDPEERFAEPYNCPWCEVVRLEALIVSTVEAAAGIDADLHAEYDRIKAKP